ncbi:MurR/RpiR family transcriptional regulator [uncultured Megamonas sp.]|uniref:MurR/RpiR family transcriptional regulator n=1 Tax=uncultured Megamonas sp. TaxID=286140 RepID=UPI00266F23A7|nr:MurR/RpiR family transcriptional regulator [uncultured Megamonas sp.]
MKILHQLDRPKFKASKSDKILIKYIKENAEKFCTTPIALLATKCKVSEATITRFVRKMGFSSLQLFKLTLTEEMVKNEKRTIISRDITSNESILITANKLLANNIATLEQTVSDLDEETLLKTVNMLKESERIFFIGLGNSGFVADDSAYKFMRIGFNTRGIDNSHLIMLHMALLHESDVVVVISHSGESFEIIKAVELAKKNGTKLIVITSNRDTILKEYADACIFYETRESTLETGSITTKLTQIFIVDLLYTQVVKDTMDLASAFKQRTTEAINILRLDNKK